MSFSTPRYKPLKFFTSTNTAWDSSAVVNTVVTGGIPRGTDLIQISVEGQAVRYRDDGGTPTTLSGNPLAVGSILSYDGDEAAMRNLRIIGQAPGAIIQFTFYAESR